MPRIITLTALFFFSSMLMAQQYEVVMVSGESYKCSEKYKADGPNFIMFTLDNGAQMSVPRDQVDWYETAVRNKEQPPPGVKPIKRRGPSNIGAAGGDDFRLPKSEGMKEDLKRFIGFWDGRGSGDADEFFSLFTPFIIIFSVVLTILGFLANSILLWFALRITGEPIVLTSLILWNLILTVGYFAIFIGLTFTGMDLVTYIVVSRVLYAVLWISVLVGKLSCDFNSAILGTIIYQAFSLLLNYGILGLLKWVLPMLS